MNVYYTIVVLICLTLFTSCEKKSEPQDMCADVVCLNDGYCSSGVCECPDGYYGTFCENRYGDDTDDDHSGGANHSGSDHSGGNNGGGNGGNNGGNNGGGNGDAPQGLYIVHSTLTGRGKSLRYFDGTSVEMYDDQNRFSLTIGKAQFNLGQQNRMRITNNETGRQTLRPGLVISANDLHLNGAWSVTMMRPENPQCNMTSVYIENQGFINVIKYQIHPNGDLKVIRYKFNNVKVSCDSDGSSEIINGEIEIVNNL